jgi:hypothetical protein
VLDHRTAGHGRKYLKSQTESGSRNEPDGNVVALGGAVVELLHGSFGDSGSIQLRVNPRSILRAAIPKANLRAIP